MPTEDIDALMSAIHRGRLRTRAGTEAIALLLHGGRASAAQPRRSRDLSYLRMLPFAGAIRRAGRGRVAPVLVHNTHGGWVAASGSGLVQARELVHELHRESGLPIVLLGHSSGGWAALRTSREEAVLGAVALAPWVAADEPAQPLADKKIRVIHGDRDTVCSPRASLEFVRRLQAIGADATYTSVPGGGHALLDKPWRWHTLAADAVAEVAGVGSRRATPGD